MPRDSLRSRIYKSFLTCNDPKGIVDSSAVRKQKVGSSSMEKEKRIKSRTRKNSYKYLDCKLQKEDAAIKGIVDEFDSSSSFQLKEVSRGAQKLKQTIDLWSNEVKYDRKSEKIAKDLFEGAVDLQESLTILRKLQEASWYMTRVKKKEQIIERRTGNIDMERRCANRLEFQKSRLSADYSHGVGAEELKKMIRDRLAKQIRNPNTTSSAEETSFPGSNMESSASEMTSSSSSQSSMVYTTVVNHENKGYGKNLIAKLMGLELQSEQMKETLHKPFLGEKISNRQRPKFSMELAEAKKPKSVTEKIVLGTSESNLETTQFKGILKLPAMKTNHYFNHSSYSHSREELTKTAIPIVLLKPQVVSQVELDECQARVVGEDEALNMKKFMNLKMKEEYPQKKNDKEVEAWSSRKVLASIGVEQAVVTRINHRKESQSPKEERWKHVECVDVIESTKRVSHTPLNQNLQLKEAVDKTVLESQKDIVTMKNRLKQAKMEPKFQEQAQVPPRKLQMKPNANEQCIPPDFISTPDNASEWSSLKNQAIKEKVINEVTIAKSMAINLEDRCDNKKPDQTKFSASLIPMKEKAGGCKLQICECCSESQNSTTHRRCRPKTDANAEEEACKYIDHGITESKTGTNPKTPISRAPPFVDHANELFHLNENGNASIWSSPNEPTPSICDAVDSWRNCIKINDVNIGIFRLRCMAPESVDEAEEVIKDLEKRILIGLIQEVFA